jgi:hypothetical protein
MRVERAPSVATEMHLRLDGRNAPNAEYMNGQAPSVHGGLVM